MKHFNWNKGIQISTQLEKFENWLKEEGLINIFETDGFLLDFSRLISTRAVMLQKVIASCYNHKNILLFP